MKVSTAVDIALICLFLGGISAPLLGTRLQNAQSVSISEKRTLARIPKLAFSAKALQEFSDEFNAYFDDHFGFREDLVHRYSYLKLLLGISPSEDVVVGRDGWFFLDRAGVIDDFRNLRPFSDDELEQWWEHIDEVSSFLASRGIAYFFVVAPNKHTIYPEYLPRSVRKAANVSRLDQLLEYMQLNSSAQVVDLRSTLLEAKRSRTVYNRTGTHWNMIGANHAQYTIFKELSRVFGDLKPKLHPLASFEYRQGGDQGLAKMLAMHGTLKEEQPYPVFSAKRCARRMDRTAENVGKRRDDYVISFTCERGKHRLLMFRDSFASALIPYLSESFAHSTYIADRPTLERLEEYLELANPDVVIEQTLERSLLRLPKRTLRERR